MRQKVFAYRINNYQLGAKLKSCPTHKIFKREREDPRHTVVWFKDLTTNELQLVNRLLTNKCGT